MTDVKRLLDEATPRPWYDAGFTDGTGTVTQVGGFQRRPENAEDYRFSVKRWEDAALLCYAVNHLPDYEAAVDALLSVAWNQSDGPCWCDHNIAGTEVTKHGDRCQKASAALRRLRGAA